MSIWHNRVIANHIFFFFYDNITCQTTQEELATCYPFLDLCMLSLRRGKRPCQSSLYRSNFIGCPRRDQLVQTRSVSSIRRPIILQQVDILLLQLTQHHAFEAVMLQLNTADWERVPKCGEIFWRQRSTLCSMGSSHGRGTSNWCPMGNVQARWCSRSRGNRF